MTRVSLITRAVAYAVIIVVLVSGSLRAADSPPPFSSLLTPAQRGAMGLDKLSPEQLAALNAAIENYRQSGEVEASRKAAATAVAEYKKKEEPGIVSRALNAFKVHEREAKQERIEAHVVGSFSGWEGHTIFRLDNNQVWQQSVADVYYTSPQENTPVTILKTVYGSYRLNLKDGAWVTVIRLK